MDKRLLCISAFLGLVFHSNASTLANRCEASNSRSCGQCMAVGPECGWCKDPGFSRCATVENLRNSGCADMIEIPHGSQTILKNSNQFRPQKLSLSLRSGEPQTFNLKLKVPEDHPIDLYYLMDLSYVQRKLTHQGKVKNFATSLMREMSKITSNFRIGFGTISGTSMDTTSIGGLTTTFKNLLKLTSDGQQFNTLVGQQLASGTLHRAVRGLSETVQQVALCGEQIGWRNGTRLLLLSPGLFSLLSTGLVPNDGQCHMENDVFTAYPPPTTVDRIAALTADSRIHLIFSLSETMWSVFQGYSESAGYKQLRNFYAKYTTVPFYEHPEDMQMIGIVIPENKLPHGVTMTTRSNCRYGVVDDGENGRKCANVTSGNELSLDIEVVTEGCPNNGKPDTININVGFTEEVEVELNFICECDCQKNAVENSELCSGEGTLECGTCRCNHGRFGRQCECISDYWYGQVSVEDLDKYCRKDEGTDICSNNGHCVCGTCECWKRKNTEERYSGKFCECDNFNCDRSNNKLCGGNGRCDCRVCVCDANYTGSACDCSLDSSTCLASNQQICNGRGNCECGNCRCTDPKFQGPTCELCPTCPGICQQNTDCVQCRAFGTGEKKDTCERDCSYFNLIKVKDREKLPQPVQVFPLVHCKQRDDNDCWFYYTYANTEMGKEVHVVEAVECPRQSSRWWWQ